MKPLKFSPDLVPLVLAGSKTATWRLFDDKDLKAGDLLTLVNAGTKAVFGNALVTEVIEKTLGTLNDADREGHEEFQSEDEMYQNYRKYYPGHEINKDTPVKIVRFKAMIQRSRPVAVLVPYQKRDGNTLIFLQRRDKDADRLPDCFGFFGGGIGPGETPEDAIAREIKEELNYELKDARFLGEYKGAWAFVAEVPAEFESKIEVREGQYGKWFTKEEAYNEPLFLEIDKEIIQAFFGSMF